MVERSTLGLIFVALLFVGGCGDRSALEFSAPAEARQLALVGKDILGTKCVSCHSNFSDEERLKRMVKDKDPEETRLFIVSKEGTMPPSGPALTTEELEALRNYLADLKRAAPTVSGKAIIADRCVACHRSFGDEERLKRMVSDKAPEDTDLYLEAQSGSMPPSGPRLTETELKAVRDYLRALKPL